MVVKSINDVDHHSLMGKDALTLTIFPALGKICGWDRQQQAVASEEFV